MPTRWVLAGLLVAAAVLGGFVALGAERVIDRWLAPIPTPQPTSAPQPTSPPVVIERPTTISTPEPTLLPNDQLSLQVARLQQHALQQEGLLLVIRAERHVALASESLLINDLVRANQELVAASAALDRAFERVSEDLKQVIENQRREVGRLRADLYVAPEGLDERLRALQDQLLAIP